jgi:hypothetical protein
MNNKNNNKKNILASKPDKHKSWLILAIVIVIIAILFLVFYSPFREALFGKALEIKPELETQPSLQPLPSTTPCPVNDFDRDGDCHLGIGDYPDCNDNDPAVWQIMDAYPDRDNDGYGDSSASMISLCTGNTLPAGYAGNNNDCNDNDAAIYPGASEVCDSKDNNCDGIVDEGFDLPTDPNNCGSCGTVCSSDETCVLGNCISITPLDSDGDGISNPGDNCPFVSNPDQADTDGDGIGNACDVETDQDDDGVFDINDNCISIFNPTQYDRDEDGKGDVCDSEPCGPNTHYTGTPASSFICLCLEGYSNCDNEWNTGCEVAGVCETAAILGDVTGNDGIPDGLINIQDILVIVSHIVGTSPLTADQITAANVNCDKDSAGQDKIDVNDVTLIVQYIILGTELVCSSP